MQMSPQTGSALTRENRGSRRPLQNGQPAPPSQMARRTLIAPEDLPALPNSWSPQMQPPMSLPSPIQIGDVPQAPQGIQPAAIVPATQSTSYMVVA